MNKVYFQPVLSRVSGVEVVGCEDGRRGFLQKPDRKNTSVESVGILGSLGTLFLFKHGKSIR